MQAPLTILAWLFLLLLSCQVNAANHAVLVGISNYPVIEPLEGPLHDVALMKKLLVNDWGHTDAEITVLLNQQATRKNILDALAAPLTSGAPGDFVFLYFSGHGTSAADTSMSIDLPVKTGALVPYDIEGIENQAELLERLIVGRRDLRPILMQLDQHGYNVVVIVDACYSGNVVRDKKQANTLPTRFIRLAELLPERRIKTELSKRLKFAKEMPFPYANVVSLVAAHEYETAQDIPASKLAQYPTIDGKPHGAFTDSLARVVSNRLEGDTNNSGGLSFKELFVAVKELMKRRKFSSTPQLLPRSPEAVIVNRDVLNR